MVQKIKMKNFISAYHKCHFAETALIRTQADIISAIDNGSSVAMEMLDLTAAFDTLDHQILVNRLEEIYSIQDVALQWFRSYLCNRMQHVMVNGETSNGVSMNHGVTQGSVLGPKLFSLYMKPLSEVIRNHGFSYQFYADDTLIYLAFQPDGNWTKGWDRILNFTYGI